MSFSFDASKAQANITAASNAPSAALPTLSFGAAGAGDAGKSISTGFPLMSAATQNKRKELFGAGLAGVPGQGTGFAGAPGQGTGFGFGTPNTSAPALGNVPVPQTSGLTFGAGATPNTGITFGATNTATPVGFPAPTLTGATPGFGLGSATTTTTVPTTGLSFGAVKPPASTGFSVGAGEANAPTAAPSLTFGTPSTLAATPVFNLGGTPAAMTTTSTTTTTPGFSLGSNITSTTASLDSAKTSTVQTGFNLAPTTLQSSSGFGTSTANTTAATTFSLGATGTPATTGFSFGTGTTAASTTGFSLNKTTAAPTSLTTPSTQISLGAITTVSSSSSGSQPVPINFYQLEESINKWTLELEEQEKVFVNQATQVNAWDRLLITNGEKIVTLNQEVERVKIEQQQLEHELDYVVGQQKELQDCLVPLEKELASLSVSDPEREYTYRLAENLDTQLKRMSEDLKEIIEHLNQANRTQDSSDPIVQIGKILNAHMNSLQWLDQQTALLSHKIQQIDQMHQNFRQENERSFNLAYN